MSVVNKTETI